MGQIPTNAGSNERFTLILVVESHLMRSHFKTGLVSDETLPMILIHSTPELRPPLRVPTLRGSRAH